MRPKHKVLGDFNAHTGALDDRGVDSDELLDDLYHSIAYSTGQDNYGPARTPNYNGGWLAGQHHISITQATGDPRWQQ